MQLHNIRNRISKMTYIMPCYHYRLKYLKLKELDLNPLIKTYYMYQHNITICHVPFYNLTERRMMHNIV
jgi:hypothetical protein